MMFTRADAEALRSQLPAMDFNAEPVTLSLLEKYRAHYDLRPDNRDCPFSHRAGLLESGAFTLVVQHFTPEGREPRGTVFLLHGYFDHVGIYRHLIRHCLGLGYGVVMFDMPGHGLSTGPAAHIDSFLRYSEALRDCLALAENQSLPRPWQAIGQSTGAAVIVEGLLEQPSLTEFEIEHYILLAPLLRPVSWRRTRLLFACTRWFLPATPRRYAENSHDPEFLAFLRNNEDLQGLVVPREWVLAMMDFQRRFARAEPQSVALKIIQGTGDATVDWRYNLPRFKDKFAGSKHWLVEDARHHLVNESEEYREKIFGLITDILQPAAQE